MRLLPRLRPGFWKETCGFFAFFALIDFVKRFGDWVTGDIAARQTNLGNALLASAAAALLLAALRPTVARWTSKEGGTKGQIVGYAKLAACIGIILLGCIYVAAFLRGKPLPWLPQAAAQTVFILGLAVAVILGFVAFLYLVAKIIDVSIRPLLERRRKPRGGSPSALPLRRDLIQ